jgi:hypothetical protein
MSGSRALGRRPQRRQLRGQGDALNGDFLRRHGEARGPAGRRGAAGAALRDQERRRKGERHDEGDGEDTSWMSGGFTHRRIIRT